MLPFFPWFNEKEKEKKDECPMVYEELSIPIMPIISPKEIKQEEKENERGVIIIELI